MRLVYRCVKISKHAGHRIKTDDSGNALRNEKGHYQYEFSESRTVKFEPVEGRRIVGQNPPEPWYGTPGGHFEIQNLSESAGDSFKIGARYFLEFTPAPADAAM